MRLLVCGGRNYKARDVVYSLLDAIHAQSPISTIIQGGATGADALAASWAYRNRVNVEEYRANWAQYGPAAGPIRNQRMLDKGRPTAYHAFPGGRGTSDMVQRCKRAGVPEV